MTHDGFTIESRELDGQHQALAALAGGAVVARLQLRARIGLQVPRHWYHVGLVVHAAPDLGLFRAQRTLLLGNDLTGHAELCAFEAADGITSSQARAVWSALTAEALRLVASDPAHWGNGLIAELPAERMAGGSSAFWHGLTRHFFRGDPQDTAARLGPDWRSHVAALLPRQPVYVSFLPESAQAAIGSHAADAQALHDGLHDAGLRWRQHVTIDEGAAVLEA